MSTVSALPRRAGPATGTPDLDAAERAAVELLTALGVDVSDQSTLRTPRRMVHAFAELLTAEDMELTTFPNDDGYEELVVVTDIEFRSLCEHHMLPFTGVAHLGYLPADRILGLSKLARLVGALAAGPQTQEGLTQRIARDLHAHLQPRGVGVVLEAEHSCMSIRGARARGARTHTSAFAGELKGDRAAREEFVSIVRGRRSTS